MAREMYLVGVDEDELKPPEPPKQPKTPKGKWENFWYHYKWHTIAIAAAALVITVRWCSSSPSRGTIIR